jgi:hypothetical protein
MHGMAPFRPSIGTDIEQQWRWTLKGGREATYEGETDMRDPHVARPAGGAS